MGLLELALRFFRSVAPETVAHLDDIETAREAERISELKAERDRADCFKRELMRLGFSETTLDAKVKAYRRGMLTEVVRGAA